MSAGANGPGLRERKKQRTRELIADTAMRLFLEAGFEAVTIADVARAADVDVKTIYNYFPSKPDLVYHRLEQFAGRLLTAISTREEGESTLSAFKGFLLGTGGTLAEERGSEKLQAINEMILASPTLRAHEEHVYAELTSQLASLLAEETGAAPADVEPRVVAHALTGMHRSLVAFVRDGARAGVPTRTLARDVRAQADQALGRLERGLRDYGVRQGTRATPPT